MEKESEKVTIYAGEYHRMREENEKLRRKVDTLKDIMFLKDGWCSLDIDFVIDLWNRADGGDGECLYGNDINSFILYLYERIIIKEVGYLSIGDEDKEKVKDYLIGKIYCNSLDSGIDISDAESVFSELGIKGYSEDDISIIEDI